MRLLQQEAEPLPLLLLQLPPPGHDRPPHAATPTSVWVTAAGVEAGATAVDKAADVGVVVDIEINDNVRIKQVVHSPSNRHDGKRQVFGQLSGRSGNTYMSGGLDNHIVGSNANGLVSMIQNLVEDMTNKPSTDRPGYIMINSRNPAVIQQLVSSLSHHYGSHSVIQDPETIQSLVGSNSVIGNTQTNPSDTFNQIPVFPYESRWDEASSSESRDPEIDYIRQQLATLGHVSTGKLVNDTLRHHTTTTPATTALTINLTAGVSATLQPSHTQEHSNSVNTTSIPDDQHSDNQHILKTSETFDMSLSQEPQSTNYQSSSEYSTLAPISTNSQELINDDGHLVLFAIEQQNENSNKLEHLVKAGPPEVSGSQTAADDNNRQTGVYINNIYYSGVAFPEEAPNDSVNSVLPPTEIPKVHKNIFNDESAFNSEEAISTTGYEDYYEEIDGVLVLSPTKFMRRGGPITSSDYSIYEDYYQIGSNKPIRTQHKGHNTVYKESIYNATHVKFQGIQNSSIDSTHGIHLLHHNSVNAPPTWPYNHRPSSYSMQNQMSQPFQADVEGMIPDHHQPEKLWKIKQADASRLPLFEELDRVPVVYGDGENPADSAPSLETLPSNILHYLAHVDDEDLKTLGLLDRMKSVVGKMSTLGSQGVSSMGEDFAEKGYSAPDLQNLTYQRSTLLTSVEESTSSQSSTFNGVSNSELQVPVRSHFSAENNRQSGLDVHNRPAQYILPAFFPTRPTQALHPEPDQHRGHQLTREQQEIISRLPAGMGPVVASIVLAEQAPSLLSTTTTRPHHYPLMPHPYPLYPSYPPTHPELHAEPGTTSSQHHAQATHPPRDPPALLGHGVAATHAVHGDNGTHSAQENHGKLSSYNHGSQNYQALQTTEVNSISQVNNSLAYAHNNHDFHKHGHHGSSSYQRNSSLGIAGDNDVPSTGRPTVQGTSVGTQRPGIVTTSSADSITMAMFAGNASLTDVFLPAAQPSSAPTLNPDIVASRLVEFDTSAVDDIVKTGIRDNNNKPANVNRVGPRPDRNQGLLQLRQNFSQMVHGPPSGSGFENYRPLQQSNTQMEAPVVNVTLPEATRNAPSLAQEETGPHIDPGEVMDDSAVTSTPQAMDREDVNSLLKSLFSSPTLLLLGIVFATSAAYMAIAMKEQAAHQRFQQAQLTAAFGGHPFPPGRRQHNTGAGVAWQPILSPSLRRPLPSPAW